MIKKKSPIAKTLLNEHYMKMKRFEATRKESSKFSSPKISGLLVSIKIMW